MDKSWLPKKIESGQRKFSNEMLDEYRYRLINSITTFSKEWLDFYLK